MRILCLLLICFLLGCVPGYSNEVTPEERVETWVQLLSEYRYAQGVRQFRDMEGLDGN